MFEKKCFIEFAGKEKGYIFATAFGREGSGNWNDMLKNSVADPLGTVRVSYLGIVQGSEKVILPVSLEKTFSKKTSEKFGRIKKSIYLCIRFPIKTEAEKKRDLW